MSSKQTSMQQRKWTMKAVSFSETSINFRQTTRRHIPQDIPLHAVCQQDLKISVPEETTCFDVSVLTQAGYLDIQKCIT
jgi:hypothetical protein